MSWTSDTTVAAPAPAPGRAGPGAEGPDGAPEPVARPRRVSWKRIGVAGLVLITLGIFGTGFGLGWAAGSRTVDGAAGNTVVEVIAAPTDSAGDLLTLPDVRGLALTDAQQAITDAGFPLAVVTPQDTPSALPAGTVVSQDPVGGTEDAGTVTLFIAVPGTVPDLLGRSADDARQALLALGARCDQRQVYDPSVAEGSVLAVDPPAGSPLAGTVTVTVAGPADSVFLADLDAVAGSCSTGEYSVDGTEHTNSLACSASSYESTTSYLTDRLVTTLEATVGIDDRSDTDVAARLTVLGDGRVLTTLEVSYGRPQDISVSVVGILRVDLVYAATGENSGYLVLGDARAVGSPEAVTTLAGS